MLPCKALQEAVKAFQSMLLFLLYSAHLLAMRLMAYGSASCFALALSEADTVASCLAISASKTLLCLHASMKSISVLGLTGHRKSRYMNDPA